MTGPDPAPYEANAAPPAISGMPPFPPPPPPPHGPPPVDGPQEGVVYQMNPAPAGQSGLYIIWGNAKFPIGSPAELPALGVSPASIQTVDPRFLATVGTFPGPGMLLRQDGHPEVYWMTPQGGLHIPTPAAMTYLRLDWNQVRTIPAGTVGQIRPFEQPSTSATPPSMVFDRNANNNADGARWPRTELPGHPLPNGNHIVLLYGWMVGYPPGAYGPGGDPDWHTSIEPDFAWLERQGINLLTFVKTGDIYYGHAFDSVEPMVFGPGDGKSGAAISVPAVKFELDGWTARIWPAGTVCPAEWQRYDAPWQTPVGMTVPAETYWGIPMWQKPAQNSYACVSGNLVTDQPHLTGETGDVLALKTVFAAGAAEHDPSNGARWTELHSPDSIVTADAPPDAPVGQPYQKAYELTGVLAVAAEQQEQLIQGRALATTPRPDVDHVLRAAEIVGPLTDPRTITTGNATKTGAQLNVYDAAATITVGVTGLSDGTPGKFMALYKTWWELAAARQQTVTTTPAADSVPLNQSTTLQVDSGDALTGVALNGTVLINGAPAGATGTQLRVVLPGVLTREWEPGDPEAIPIVKGRWVTVRMPQPVTVHVDGYLDVTIEVGTPPA